MKTLIFTFTLFLAYSYGNCQSLDVKKVELTVADIEKGLENVDPLRVILIEQGFELSKKTEESNNSCGVEYWDISYYFEYKQKIVSVFLLTNNSIHVDIKKGFMNDLADEFVKDIRSKYPLKKTSPIRIKRYTPNSSVADTVYSTKYEIIYSKKESNVEVAIFEESDFFSFKFRFKEQ